MQQFGCIFCFNYDTLKVSKKVGFLIYLTSFFTRYSNDSYL